MFQHDLREALQLHRAARGILYHALAAVTFDQTLDGVEQIRPHGLRAKISAPDTSADRIHQKEGNRRDNQQPGKIVDLLRPQLDEEEIETAIGKVYQHRLIGRTQTAIPPHERQQVIDTEAECHQSPFDAAKCSGDALRINLLMGDIKPVSYTHLRAHETDSYLV